MSASFAPEGKEAQMGQLDTPNRSYQGGITTRDFWRQRAWGLLKMGNPKSQHGVTFFRRFGKVNQDIPQCSVESLAATVTEPTEQTRTWSLGWSWRNSARNIAQNAIFTQVSTTRNIWFLYIAANVDAQLKPHRYCLWNASSLKDMLQLKAVQTW